MYLSKNTKYRMVLILVCSLFLPTTQKANATGEAGKNPRGWWPQEYTVQRDDASGILTLSTPYYTVRHDLKKGGAVTGISLTHGKADNLLVQPIATTVRLVDESDTARTARGPGARLIFSDLNNPSPALSRQKSGKSEIVVFECALLDEKGRDSGVTVKTTYTYRWGYIKIHKEFIISREPVKVRNICLLSTILDPSLSDYGYRPGIREMMDADLFSWRHGQIRRWGKIRPGTHFDIPFRTRQIPRYLVFANHGIEGIEWFMSDDLRQWDYQVTGQPGTGFCRLRPSTNPLGIEVSIFPVMLSDYYKLHRGGMIELKGSYAFDYYIGVPILEGHANKPWLDRGYLAKGGEWVSEEEIKKFADSDVITMRLHNDGDHLGDGLFWRDGSYPPYPPKEMEKMDRVIENIHKYGMKTTPYFSNHELHQSTGEFKQHGEEWGRIVDDQENLRPNYVFGAHMCLKSGWLDFLKFSIDRVLKNHDFDGVYYDWHIAMFCNNPLHVGETSTGISGGRGLGTMAVSPTAHWDIDELIDLVEWSRERVGSEGLIMLHNTLVPMFATENFANYVVGMEFTYGKLSKAMPKPDELPLEWNFAGARSRGVIGYGAIARGAPRRIHQLLALTALMTSVAPWPASEEALELFKILKPLKDIEQYKFEDWRNTAVKLDNRDCTSAVYSKPAEAWVLLANYESEPKKISCTIYPGSLQYPLSSISSGEIVDKDGSISLDPGKLAVGGETVTIPADGAVLIHIE